MCAFFNANKERQMKSFLFFRRFLLALTASFIFLSAAISAENQTYYRWYDENGNLHFNDTPPPKAGIKIEQKQLKTEFLQKTLFDQATQKNVPVFNPKVPNTFTAQQIHLISPKNEAVFHTNNGTLTLTFVTDKPLSAKQYVRVIVNNKVYSKSQTSPLSITGLNRGEHKLHLDLIENKKIIASSETVRFFIHSASAITPQGQGVMAPTAPKAATLPTN